MDRQKRLMGMKFPCIKMSQYFPKLYEPSGGDISFKVDWFKYATKAGLKKATGIDTSKLAAKSDLASLKAEVDELDIDKLIPVPADLNKLSDVVKNYFNNNIYDKLVAKVNNIIANGLFLKKVSMTQMKEN